MKVQASITFFSLFLFSSLSSYTIEEKKESLVSLVKDSQPSDLLTKNSLSNLYEKLENTYIESTAKIANSENEDEFAKAKDEILAIRKEIKEIELSYKDSPKMQLGGSEEETRVWAHSNITISKLIMEYGSFKSLYTIPANIANIKVSIHSLLSIPKGSWDEMISLILAANHIGVKKSGPYVKKLYLLKEDHATASLVTSSKKHLELLNPTDRIIFLYSPPLQNIKTCFYFLDRLKNTNATYISQVGSKICLSGLVSDVASLVNLCDQVWDTSETRVAKIYVPTKISTEDSIKLLKTFYGGLTDFSSPLISMKGGNGLSAFALTEKTSILLTGKDSLVEEAIAMLKKTENQVNNPSESVLFWHTCSHCNPVELAEILSKVYSSLISCSMHSTKESANSSPKYSFDNPAGGHLSHSPFDKIDDPDADDIKHMVVEKKQELSQNFFPYPSNNSLLMVIRKSAVLKIKEIIKKLDTPKKMVEIEILLCERRANQSSKSGINMLKVHDSASNSNSLGASFGSSGPGILEFIVSTKDNLSKNIPAIDLTYNFLLSQEDMSIHTTPSTTTLNQVPTTLSITDQISIKNGVELFKHEQKASYDREDFGITITITPTIHEKEMDSVDDMHYITLENDIQFDTITSNIDQMPAVHKRHIKNTVRIKDGETIILGGLRNKNEEKGSYKIPFLGEIPGFGKIFGANRMQKKSSEMFIFIKPRIIESSEEKILQLREAALKARPGESDLFNKKLVESRRQKENLMFQKSFSLFLGS